MATPAGQFIFMKKPTSDELRNGSGGRPTDDIDNVNEVSRRPPGPAYGPVVYFAPQHDPAVKTLVGPGQNEQAVTRTGSQRVLSEQG